MTPTCVNLIECFGRTYAPIAVLLARSNSGAISQQRSLLSGPENS